MAGSWVLRAAALGAAGATAALAGASPLGPLEASGLAAGGYGLSLLSFAAFPRLRRNDLVLSVAAFFVALSFIRYLGEAADMAWPFAFGLIGAAAAWLPSRVDRFRSERRAERRAERRGRRASARLSPGSEVSTEPVVARP